MNVIFFGVGMCTYLWMANKVTAHKELKIGLHTLQSTYITIVE